MPQSHQSPLHSTDESHVEPSQRSGGGDADGVEDAGSGGDADGTEDAYGGDGGNDFEDTDGGTDDNAEDEPNPKPVDLGQGLAGKRQLSPISPSDEGLMDAKPNPPRRGRSKHAPPTSKCGCAEVCRDVVKTLAQDRKFMGIDLGLTALKAVKIDVSTPAFQ